MSSLPVPSYYNQYTAKERSYIEYMGEISKSISSGIEAGANKQIAAGALFTREIQSTLVSNQLATETALYNHTRQLESSLNAGFSAVSRELGYMGSAMSMGFASLGSAVEKSSRAICQKLDDINETLKNPLYTQSRELYNRAARNYNKALYEEALEDLEEAVKKNKTDPFSHFLMGQTYLYGISEFSNVIDLEKAVEALVNAAKYITPDARAHAEIRPMAAEIYFHLGLAYQTKAYEDFRNAHEEDAQKRLTEAKAAYKKSREYSPAMLEALYNLARCEALSGEAEEAETDLMFLMVKDTGYFIKAFAETDFDAALKDGLKGRIKREVYPGAKAVFDKLVSVRAELGDAISPELAASLPAAFTEDTPPFDALEGNLRFPVMLPVIIDELKRKRAVDDDELKRKRAVTDDEPARKRAAILQTHIAAGLKCTVGLKTDGDVITAGDYRYRYLDCYTFDGSRGRIIDETYVVAIAVSSYTVGLTIEGTVVAFGMTNKFGECNTWHWQDIIAIAAGYQTTVGLKKDGTVVAVGRNDDGQCNTQDWRDIAAIAVEYHTTVGLKKDGTVVAVGKNKEGTRDWRDIAAIAAGSGHTVGLKKDGTVVAVGYNDHGQCNTRDWRDIIAIAAGYKHTVGLKKDGTVVAVGYNLRGQCNTRDWRDIIAIAAGGEHTVGLKKDGAVVAVGSNSEGQCDTGHWRDIDCNPISAKEKIEATRQAEQRSKDWEAQGRCRYCGGKMKGIFSKVCAVCGKPK